MSYTIERVPPHTMVFRTAGRSDIADLRRMIDEIAAAVRGDAELRILADRRDSEYVAPAEEVREVVAMMKPLRGEFQGRVAVLTLPGGKFEMAQAFADASRGEGFSVQAFTEEAAALAWLEAE